MNGQWLGPFSGASSGILVLDLDTVKAGYEGIAVLYNQDANLPAMQCAVSIPQEQTEGKSEVYLMPLQRESSLFLSREQVAKEYPNAVIPTKADVSWKITAEDLSLEWTTDLKSTGSALLRRTPLNTPSDVPANERIRTWRDFKEYVAELEPHQYIFRGQEDSTWRLRSSFHRTGRASLWKFINQDVQSLHRHLSGLTAHVFNLNNALEYAAFLHLIQHHGYPTPMLDWTRSPFIAAYFAFRNIQKVKEAKLHKIRIFAFDGATWNARFRGATALMPAYLHLTLLEPLAINNPRVVPQQSVSSVSNLDDLERYLEERGREAGVPFLTAIDLPAAERRSVMQELGLMGINAGSLFPGLEGACQQLRERYFDL